MFNSNVQQWTKNPKFSTAWLVGPTLTSRSVSPCFECSDGEVSWFSYALQSNAAVILWNLRWPLPRISCPVDPVTV